MTTKILKTKEQYYPKLSKRDLFAQGYILAKSTHSRGSAVDLTIVKLEPETNTHTELDMGTIFDFFGDESHTDYPNISVDALMNPPNVKVNHGKTRLQKLPQRMVAL